MLRRGEHVVLRDVYGDKVRYVRPATVVHDRPEEVALYLAVGTPMIWSDGTRECYDRIQTRRNILMLLKPDVWHGIWLMWWHTRWEFWGWYVNFQLPFKRSPLGFDTADQALDITVDPDYNWKWKDEDQFAHAQKVGSIKAEDAIAVQVERPKVIRQIEAREYPFTCDWITWRPDADWTIPELPPNWAVVNASH